MSSAFNTCRSPSESKHRLMYKASTPPWKETYRKRCQERLAVNRQSFLERFRHNETFDDEEARKAIHSLVLNEWSSFEKDIKGSSSLDTNMISSLPADEVDQILSIFDEITQELLHEEQQIIAEYEASCQLEERILCSAVERLCSSEVLCPVCQRSPLFINKGIVFCNCGVRIDTEQDAITLDMIKANLDEGVRQHSVSCECAPYFSVVSHIGINNLLMTCGVYSILFNVLERNVM